MALKRCSLIFAALCVFALAAIPVLSADWPLGRCDSSCTGYTPERLAPPLSLAWEFNSFKPGKNTAAPIVAGGVVYFAAGDRLLALDAESGRYKWSFPADAPLAGTIKASPAYSNGTVFFGASDGSMYAVRATDGIMLWSFPTSAAVRGAPVVDEGIVYFGCDDNRLYALHAESGEMAWKGPFNTKDDVASPPAVSDGYVVFACNDALIYMASASSGSERWEYRLPMAPVRSAPAVYDDVVHIAAANTLYAISRKTGKLRWSTPFKSDIAAGPTVAENTDPVADDTTSVSKSVVYVVTRSNKLYALRSNGRPKWAAPVDLPYNCSVAPIVAGNLVIVGGERGSLCAYDALTSKLIWQYNLLPAQFKGPGNYTAVSAPPTVAGGKLFVLTDDGSLHCFDSLTPDNTAPESFKLLPARGTAMSGSPPIDISAIVYDLGCGVDPATIELSLDGAAVQHLFDVSNSAVFYQTTGRLDNAGRHELVLKAKDWRGNAMATNWSFIVDNSLRPPPAPRQPAKPTPRKPTPGGVPPDTAMPMPAPVPPDGGPGVAPGGSPGSGSGWPHVRRNRPDAGSPPPPPPGGPGGFTPGPGPDNAEPAPPPAG